MRIRGTNTPAGRKVRLAEAEKLARDLLREPWIKTTSHDSDFWAYFGSLLRKTIGIKMEVSYMTAGDYARILTAKLESEEGNEKRGR